MERTLFEMCRSSSLRAGRGPDRYLHEYAECRAEFGRVVPVARLVLPATLMEYTLIFQAGLCVAPLGQFLAPRRANQSQAREYPLESMPEWFRRSAPEQIGGRLRTRMECTWRWAGSWPSDTGSSTDFCQ